MSYDQKQATADNLEIDDIEVYDQNAIKYNYGPVLKDPSLTVEEVVSGLNWPTTMAFVGNDILVLEKNTGKIRLVREGVLMEESVAKLDVVYEKEQGLLGIAAKNSVVYLYYTQKDANSSMALGNFIYKYEWDGNQLSNPILLKKLSPNPSHIGGTMVVDLDGNVYVVVGDHHHKGILQNYPTGEPDDTGVILSVEPSGPYRAIGIRNSFGLTVDPFTGNLWDTENAPKRFDEINLVSPKFNSGWEKIMGPATETQIADLPLFKGYIYSDPEFSWEIPVAPTAIAFVDSDLFERYHDSVLVGDFLNGILYEFKLNKDRTGFIFKDPSLTDLVANSNDSMNEIILGTGFGAITDIKIGPDGFIYIVSIESGAIYRIIPKENSGSTNIVDCNNIPSQRVNLSGCNMSGLNLQNLDLSFSNLTNANFTGTNFDGTILSNSYLTGADLTGTTFVQARLVNTDVRNTKLLESDLSHADIRYSSLSNSDLTNAKLSATILRGANLDNANMENVDLSYAVLSFANLNNVNLEGADLTGTDLQYSNFINANLMKANFTKARLQYTNLVNTNLIDTDFKNSQFTYVNFSGSNLSGANMLGTYPYNVDFTGVTITKDTKVDSCLGSDLHHRALNKALRELRQIDFILLKPLEWLFVQICSIR